MEDKKEIYGLLFFSGTGNTEYVALRLRDRILAAGQKCNAIAADRLWADSGRSPGRNANLEAAAIKLKNFLKDASVLILAYPTYASDIPKPMAQLIPLLPDGNGRKLAVISTVAMAGGDACMLPIKKLKKRGYKGILAAYVKMPNNLQLPPLKVPLIKNGEALEGFYASSAKTMNKIVDKLLKGEAHLEGTSFTSFLTGVIQRSMEGLLDNWVTKNMFASENCIKCGLCVSTCPMANISFKEDLPIFGKNCCWCLRCYNFCPACAIQVTQKTKNAKKYARYHGFNKWKPPRLYGGPTGYEPQV